MASKTVIILGSSRSDGDTAKVVDDLIELTNWDKIDLNDYKIGYYDYQQKNLGDDFLPLIKKVIEEYDTLVFATPVYWYAMSGIMKVFFDRFTDLLTLEKDLGRKLRGKNMAAISCSTGNNLGEHFWLPFSESADYLGMNYLGGLHTILNEGNNEKLKVFIESFDPKD